MVRRRGDGFINYNTIVRVEYYLNCRFYWDKMSVSDAITWLLKENSSVKLVSVTKVNSKDTTNYCEYIMVQVGNQRNLTKPQEEANVAREEGDGLTVFTCPRPNNLVEDFYAIKSKGNAPSNSVAYSSDSPADAPSNSVAEDTPSESPATNTSSIEATEEIKPFTEESGRTRESAIPKNAIPTSVEQPSLFGELFGDSEAPKTPKKRR